MLLFKHMGKRAVVIAECLATKISEKQAGLVVLQKGRA
jgi:hypothetical protein